MFPKIITIQTQVVKDSDGKPVIQFRNSKKNPWEREITLEFTRSGMAIFMLNTDDKQDPYIFFGAIQKTEDGCSPDTNWDFTINGEGNIICFNNDCKSDQNISIKLTLIPRGDDNISDALVSADPRIKNEPD